MRAGKGLISRLAVMWALGIASLALANRPGAPPAGNGHFWVGSVLLVS